VNDPHVAALYYSVKHAEDVDYDKAPRVEHHEPGFTVALENDRAEIVMVSHHTTAEDARAEVEPFLGQWSLMAALIGVEEFEFIYDHACIIERNPTPGTISGGVLAGLGSLTANTKLQRPKYPDPPPAGIRTR
jgi:hypothetical protein